MKTAPQPCRQILTLLAASALCVAGCDVKTTPSDSLDDSQSLILLPSGKPAVGVRLTAFHADYLPEDTAKVVEPFTLRVDGSGRYDVAGIPTGFYNLRAQADSLVAYRDSVELLGKAPTLILEKPGSWVGQVDVRSTQDPRPMRVRLQGTDRIAYPDSAGVITLGNLGAGVYRAHIDTDVPGYGTLVQEFRIFTERTTVTPHLDLRLCKDSILCTPASLVIRQAEDGDSQFVMATDHGLLLLRKRDNALSWILPRSAGFSSNRVQAFALDRKGGAYLVLEGAQLAHFQDGQWQRLPRPGLDTAVYKLAYDRFDRLWALGKGGLVLRSGDGWTTLGNPEDIKGGFRDLKLDWNANAWLMTSRALYRREAGNWEFVDSIPEQDQSGNSLGKENVREFEFTRTGMVWCLHDKSPGDIEEGGWMSRYQDGSWNRVQVGDPNSFVLEIKDFKTDSEGDVYIHINYAIYRIRGGTQSYLTQEGLLVPLARGGMLMFSGDKLKPLDDMAQPDYSLKGYSAQLP